MIEFEESEHIYRVKGKVVPSVTQIIGAVRPTRKWFTNHATERGRQVHLALQYFDEGILEDCPDEYLGYIAAYEFFKDSADWMPLRTNVRLHNPKLKYCGAADVTGLYSGKDAVLDFKTGEEDPGNIVQVAAYGMALKIDVRFVLYLRANGKFKLVPASGVIVENRWRSHVEVYYWYKG